MNDSKKERATPVGEVALCTFKYAPPGLYTEGSAGVFGLLSRSTVGYG